MDAVVRYLLSTPNAMRFRNGIPDDDNEHLTNEAMVDQMVLEKCIKTKKIELAFRKVDRAIFVPESEQEASYSLLPLRDGLIHISAPPMYATVLENLLPLEKGMNFLNIGSGTGYLNSLVWYIVNGVNGVREGEEQAVNRLRQVSGEVFPGAEAGVQVSTSGGQVELDVLPRDETTRTGRSGDDRGQKLDDQHVSLNHGVEIWSSTIRYAEEAVRRQGLTAGPQNNNISFFKANIFSLDTDASAKYDRIYLGSCAPSSLKHKLYELLEIGGVLVGPFALKKGQQMLRRVTRKSRTEFETVDLETVQFAVLLEPVGGGGSGAGAAGAPANAAQQQHPPSAEAPGPGGTAGPGGVVGAEGPPAGEQRGTTSAPTMDSTTTTVAAAAPGTTSTSSATSSSTGAPPIHPLTRITTGVSVNLNLGANALSIQPIVETIQPIESDDETRFSGARGQQCQLADHGERLLRKADEELSIVKSFFSRGVGLGLPSGAEIATSSLVQEEDVDVEFQDELSSSCSSSGESYVHVEEDRPPPAGAAASSTTAPALAATSDVLAVRGVENEVEHQDENEEVQLLVRRNAFDHHRAVPMTGIVVGAEGDVGGERSSDDEMMSIPDESPVDCEMAISPMPRSPTAKLLVMSREVHRSGATRDESEEQEEQEEEAEDPLPAPPAAPRLRPSPAPFALSDIPSFSLSTSTQTNNYRRRRSEPDEEAARQNPPSRRRIDPRLAGEGDGASRRTSIASTVATRTNDEGSGVLEGVDPDSTTPAEIQIARPPEDLHAGAPSWRSSSASAVSTMSSSLGFFGVLGGAATSSLLTGEPDAMAGDVLGESTRGDYAYRPLPGDHSEADEQEAVDDHVEAEQGTPAESEVATPSNVASSSSALISAAPRQARSSPRRPRSATEIIQNAVTSRSSLERIHEGASRLASLQRRIIERRVIAEQLAAAEQNASSSGTTSVAGASGATGGASVVEDSRAATRGPGRQRIYTGSFWEDFRRTRAAATNGSHTNAARTSAGSASSLLANRDSSVSVFSDAAGAGPGAPAPAQGGQDQRQVLSAALGGASSSSSSSTATGSATVTEDITTSGNNRDSDSEMEQQRLLAQRRPRPFSRRGRVNNAPAGAPAPPEDVENITTGASSPGTTGTGPRPGSTNSPAAGRGGAAAASNALAARGESIYGYQSVPKKGDAGRRPRVDFLPDMFVWNEERHRYFPKQSKDAVLTILQVLNYDNCRKRAVLDEAVVVSSPRLAGSELRDLLPPKEIWLRHILPCCNKYWFLQPEAQAIKNSPEGVDIISLHGNLPAQVLAGPDDVLSTAGGGPAASTLLKEVDADGASASQSRGSSTRLNPLSRSNSSSSSSSSLARRHTSLSVEDVDAVTTAELGGRDVLGSDSAVPRDPAIRASSSTTSASSRRPGALAPLSQRTVCAAPEDDNDTNEPLGGAGYSGTSPQDRGPGLGRRSPSLATTAATLNMPPTPTSLIGSPQYARLTGLSPSAEQTPLTTFATPLATPSHSHTLFMSSTLPPGSTTSAPNPIPEDGPSSTTGTVPFIASTATASTSSSTSSASSPPDPQQPSCVGSTHSPHSRRPPIFETMVSTGKRHQLLLNDPDDDEDDRQGQPQLPPDIVAWIAAAAAHAGLQDEDIPRLFENVNGIPGPAGAAAAGTTGNGPGVGAGVGSGAQDVSPNAAP